ncbi:unnamed protein product, partial [Musa banksii]
MCFPSATSAYVRGCRCFMALRRFRGLRRWTSSASIVTLLPRLPFGITCFLLIKNFMISLEKFHETSPKVDSHSISSTTSKFSKEHCGRCEEAASAWGVVPVVAGREAAAVVVATGNYDSRRTDDCGDCGGYSFPASPLYFFTYHGGNRWMLGSAFSKPILPLSSSLIPSRGGGGCCDTAATGGERNGASFGSSTIPTATEENSSSHSNTRNPDPAPISVLSPVGAGASLPNSIQSAEVKTAVTTVDASVKYKECLRNHAAAIGGHVLDGCGEFMPEGGPSTPEALKCAACGCHRSFHRKDGDTDVNADNSYHHHHHGASHLPLLLPPPHPQSHPYNQQKPFPFGFPSSPPSRAVPLSSAVMAFGGNTCGSGGTTTESSSEERINAGAPTPAIALRKRFRTKFTAEQKEKMLAFAERVGWRIQKQEEAVVEQFCAEVGVRR